MVNIQPLMPVCIKYAKPMVFINLNRDNFEKYPAFRRNITNYRRYSEAMSDKGLTALREKLLANPYEKRLLDGGFVEKSYKKSKIYSSGDSALFDNPFDTQKPFLRRHTKRELLSLNPVRQRCLPRVRWQRWISLPWMIME